MIRLSDECHEICTLATKYQQHAHIHITHHMWNILSMGWSSTWLANQQTRQRDRQRKTYSRRAWGSFCICCSISCMAGSAMICCISGSCIARRRTASGSLFSCIRHLLTSTRVSTLLRYVNGLLPALATGSPSTLSLWLYYAGCFGGVALDYRSQRLRVWFPVGASSGHLGQLSLPSLRGR